MALPVAGLLALVLVQQASTTPVAFPVSTPAEVRAVRATAGISIDGILDEPSWQGQHGVSAFTQREPDQGSAPTERTLVFMAFDNEAIYVGARLFDSSPDSVVARLARRDRYTSADMFYVFLDPYLDRRTGFYFAVNAAGTLYDGVLYNDDWDDDNWDGVWEAKTMRDAEGWTVEMRIPYSQLRFHQADQQRWGINFKREIARKNEQTYLTFTPRNQSGFVSRFVPLVGIDGVKPPARLEILPYITSRASMTNPAAGNPFNDGRELSTSVGTDLKFGIGSNLTVDATINPDFGQVEVDPAVVNLSDFETFFPEKRPFFIEGSTIFDFGYGGSNNNWGFNWGNPDFFYTRRVGRAPQGRVPSSDYARSPDGTSILGAAKLTGKVAGWNFGTMQALTGREMARLDVGGSRSEAEVEPRSWYGVLRSQREMNGGAQGIGLIATSTLRDFDDPRLRNEINSSAFTLGVDGWTFLDRDKVWVISGWTGASMVQGSAERITRLQRSSLHYFQRPDAAHLDLDPSATSLSGLAGRVALNKQKGNWRFNSALGVVTPGFDVNDLGFQSRTDVINTHAVVGRRWSTPGKTFRFVNTNTALFGLWDFGGELTGAGVFHNAYFQFLNYHSIEYILAVNPDRLSNRLTRGGPYTRTPAGIEAGLFYSSDERKSVSFNANIYTYTAQERSSVNREVSAGVEWRPSSNMTLSFSPRVSRSFTAAQYVGTFADPMATETFGNRYVFAELGQTSLSGDIRMNWIFNPKLSLELFAQPLIASGDYYHFKELAKPRTYDFNRYGQNGSTFDGQTYTADPDGPGPATPIAVGNPDFNFRSLRGNAVLRWEYLPGSTLFLVWTQSRSSVENIGNFRFGHSAGELLRADADNIFAVKLTYWWNP